MFPRIGKLVTSYWPLVLVFWLVALAAAKFSAPDWMSVATDGELRHLPESSPTRVGGRLYEEAFPEDITDSSIVVVVHRPDQPLTQADERFIVGGLVPKLRELAERRGGLIRGEDLLDWLEQQLQQARRRAEDALGRRGSLQLAEFIEPLQDAVGNSEDNVQSAAAHADVDELLDAAADAMERTPPEPSGTPRESSRQTDAEPRQAKGEPLQAKGEALQAKGEALQAGRSSADESHPRIVSIGSIGDPLLGPMLRSADGHSTLVALNLTSGFLETQNNQVTQAVLDLLARLEDDEEIPAGLELAVAGSTMVGADTIRAVTDSTEAVRVWATWIVIALLLVVYRSPVAAILPLAAMYLAVEITLALLSWGAYFGVMEVFDGLKLYVSIIVYGAGVDYSLFLVSRHREEMSDGKSVTLAATTAIASVGTAIAASAGTEIVGIGMLYFAEFGKFQQAGIGISLGLLLLLLVSLTFTPALLCLVGRLAFWPQRLRRSKTDEMEPTESGWGTRLWQRIGDLQQQKPLRVWLGTVAVMAPLAVFGAFNVEHLTYDLTSSLPADSISLRGIAMLREHFSEGATGPVTLLLRDDDMDFSSGEGIRQIETLTHRLNLRRQELGVDSIRSVADPLGISERAEQVIVTLASITPDISFLNQRELVVGEIGSMKPSVALLQLGIREFAYRHFVSQAEPYKNHVTWLTITPAGDPYAAASIARLDEIEQAVAELLPPKLVDADMYLLGATASLRDVRDVARRDWRRIAILVPLAVLAVLMVLLRKFIIPTYLMMTVGFSFLFTMGVTVGVFWLLDGSAFVGLQWTVPILLFVLLIAIGQDYSVLLVSRTDEEQAKHGARRGITSALVKTGGLISGAGLIMGGTFAALALGGTLRSMHQLGFALTFGIFVDTFVVRPLLVPSFQHLLLNWRRRGSDTDRPAQVSDDNYQQEPFKLGHPQPTAGEPLAGAAAVAADEFSGSTRQLSDAATSPWIVRGCRTCGLVQQVHPDVVSACSHCGTEFKARADRSNSLAMGLALSALLLYIPAITLPFLEVSQLGHAQQNSLLGGAVSLLAHGDWFAGMIVLLFSVIVPPIKLIAILLLGRQPTSMSPRLRARTYRAVEQLGRWGMLDVLLVAVLVAYVKLGEVAQFHAEWGLGVFGGFVLLSLLTTFFFHHEAIWPEVAMRTQEGGPLTPRGSARANDESPAASAVSAGAPASASVTAAGLATANPSTRANHSWSGTLSWLLPLLTLVVMGAVAYRVWLERGTEIQVAFSEGYGLKEGDEVRYLGAVVGHVKQLELDRRLHGVEVVIQLKPTASSLAREGSQFWIVRPQLGLARLSGLDTFVGANYVGVLPGPKNSAAQLRFLGLPEEPIADTLEPGGLHIVLESDDASGVTPGSPIYYRELRIGGIHQVKLASDSSAVEFLGYVRPDYKHLVRSDARFWKFDGIQIEAGLSGFSLKVGPIPTLLVPGVALAIPNRPAELATEGHRFQLSDEPEEEWLSWSPSLGSGTLPSNLPRPQRVALEWTEPGLAYLYTSTQQRIGWAVPTEDGFLLPRNLVSPPASANEASARLVMSEQRLEVPQDPQAAGVEIVKLEAPHASTAGYPLIRREAKSPEDVLIVSDPSKTPTFVSASRLRFVGETWQIDESLPIASSSHGAAVVSVKDGSLVGMLLFPEEENQPWIGLLRGPPRAADDSTSVNQVGRAAAETAPRGAG